MTDTDSDEPVADNDIATHVEQEVVNDDIPDVCFRIRLTVSELVDVDPQALDVTAFVYADDTDAAQFLTRVMDDFATNTNRLNHLLRRIQALPHGQSLPMYVSGRYYSDRTQNGHMQLMDRQLGRQPLALFHDTDLCLRVEALLNAVHTGTLVVRDTS